MKRFFIFFICLFPLSIYAVNLTKITMDSGASSIGQGIDIYANGNQQARLYLHAYGEEGTPTRDEVINNLTIYNNNKGPSDGNITRDILTNNSLYTLTDHSFPDGLFSQSLMSKKSFILRDSSCSSSSNCITIPIFFQTNQAGNTPICAKIGDLNTCSESSDTPIIVNAHSVINYTSSNFSVTCSAAEIVQQSNKFTCKVESLGNLAGFKFIHSVNVSSDNILANYPYSKILTRGKSSFSFEFLKPASTNLNKVDTVTINGMDIYGNLIQNLSNPNTAVKTRSCEYLNVVVPKGYVYYNYNIKHGSFGSSYQNSLDFKQSSYGPNVSVTSIMPGVPGQLITNHQQNYCFWAAGDISASVSSNPFDGNFNFTNKSGDYVLFDDGIQGVSMIYGTGSQKVPNIYLMIDNGLVDKIDYNSLQSRSVTKFIDSDLKGLNAYADQIKYFSSTASYSRLDNANFFFLNDNKNFLICKNGFNADCKLTEINNWAFNKLTPFANKITTAFDFWGYNGNFKTYFILNDGTYISYDIINGDFSQPSGPKPIDDTTWPGLKQYATNLVAGVAAADGNQYMFINDGTNEDSVIIYDMNNDKILEKPTKIGDIWPELRNHHIKAAILAPETMN